MGEGQGKEEDGLEGGGSGRAQSERAPSSFLPKAHPEETRLLRVLVYRWQLHPSRNIVGMFAPLVEEVCVLLPLLFETKMLCYQIIHHEYRARACTDRFNNLPLIVIGDKVISPEPSAELQETRMGIAV